MAPVYSLVTTEDGLFFSYLLSPLVFEEGQELVLVVVVG